MKTDKEFKCVGFKHEAQMQIYKEIKNLTPEADLKLANRVASGDMGVLPPWASIIRRPSERGWDGGIGSNHYQTKK